MKILVVGPSWVGDMMMAQSLYRTLRARYPQAIIDVMAPAWCRPLLSRMPEVNEAIPMPLGHGALAIGERRKLGHSLRERRYDRAYVLPNSFKSALVPFFANTPLRTGWRGEMRYGLLNDARVLEIVKNELLDMKKRFGDERRTEIQSVTGEVDIEDLIAEEQCVYTLTEAGYIKRQLKATYQAQKRGGRGISGMTRKEEDIVQEMFVGSTHDYVLFVTDKGRLFRIKGYTIAEGSRTSKGSNIVNLLQLAEGEKVTNMLCYPKDEDNKGGFVTMVTKQGLIKRTPLEQYANIRKTGLIGIALNEGDALAWTRLTTGNDMLIVATRNGQAIRFNEADARPMGRSGHGVRAIKLAEGDEVVGVCICREGATVLTVTENGKGRRSEIDTYRITARGGKGIRNYDASKDKVAAVKIVDDVDDILLSSQEGIIIRFHADSIPVQSRYGSGVRVMRLGESDKVMVLARTDHDDEAQTAAIEAEEGDEPTAEQLAAMEAADEASAAETPEADSEN